MEQQGFPENQGGKNMGFVIIEIWNLDFHFYEFVIIAFSSVKQGEPYLPLSISVNIQWVMANPQQ